MNRADWLGRLLCAAMTFGTAWLRGALYSPPHTLLGVGIGLCLSALCNTCALIAASAFVRGKASYDLQRLAYCAIVVNFLGFAAYAAKSSPSVYWANTAITVISYAQLLRLIWPGNGDNFNPRWRHRFFRVAYFQGEGFHMETKK